MLINETNLALNVKIFNDSLTNNEIKENYESPLFESKTLKFEIDKKHKSKELIKFDMFIEEYLNLANKSSNENSYTNVNNLNEDISKNDINLIHLNKYDYPNSNNFEKIKSDDLYKEKIKASKNIDKENDKISSEYNFLKDDVKNFIILSYGENLKILNFLNDKKIKNNNYSIRNDGNLNKIENIDNCLTEIENIYTNNISNLFHRHDIPKDHISNKKNSNNFKNAIKNVLSESEIMNFNIKNKEDKEILKSSNLNKNFSDNSVNKIDQGTKLIYNDFTFLNKKHNSTSNFNSKINDYPNNPNIFVNNLNDILDKVDSTINNYDNLIINKVNQMNKISEITTNKYEYCTNSKLENDKIFLNSLSQKDSAFSLNAKNAFSIPEYDFYQNKISSKIHQNYENITNLHSFFKDNFNNEIFKDFISTISLNDLSSNLNNFHNKKINKNLDEPKIYLDNNISFKNQSDSIINLINKYSGKNINMFKINGKSNNHNFKNNTFSNKFNFEESYLNYQ